MAKPRLPIQVAEVSGKAARSPGRFAGRTSPKGLADLGPASGRLGPFERRAFDLFRRELPWLKESDRCLVEMACAYRAQMLDPDAAPVFAELQELRRCLGQLGATPADRSKVFFADDDEDPDDAYFNTAGQRPH